MEVGPILPIHLLQICLINVDYQGIFTHNAWEIVCVGIDFPLYTRSRMITFMSFLKARCQDAGSIEWIGGPTPQRLRSICGFQVLDEEGQSLLQLAASKGAVQGFMSGNVGEIVWWLQTNRYTSLVFGQVSFFAIQTCHYCVTVNDSIPLLVESLKPFHSSCSVRKNL